MAHSMLIETGGQFSRHELKPVSIGSFTSKVSENSGYYFSVLCFHFFWDTEQEMLLHCDTQGVGHVMGE